MYAVLAGVKKEDADDAVQSLAVDVLQNDGSIQAIAYKNKVMAVFYRDTVLKTENHTIKAEQPCFILLDDNEQCLYISTPDKDKNTLSVVVDGKPLRIAMPEERILRGKGMKAEF